MRTAVSLPTMKRTTKNTYRQMVMKFIQPATADVRPFERDFENFKQAREWVIKDLREGYGDILLYCGWFVGLSEDQERELRGLTLGDAVGVDVDANE